MPATLPRTLSGPSTVSGVYEPQSRLPAQSRSPPSSSCACPRAVLITGTHSPQTSGTQHRGSLFYVSASAHCAWVGTFYSHQGALVWCRPFSTDSSMVTKALRRQ